MSNSVEFPWDRYSVIAEIAYRVQQREHRLGKTALQKFVYFLQELEGVGVGYEFSLYTYGPYSAHLMQEFDVTQAMGVVDVHYDARNNAYSIYPGQELEPVRRHAIDILLSAGPALDRILDDFVEYNARDLELRATVVYMERAAHRKSQPITETELIDQVYDVKPHFSREDIREAVTELTGKGYVKTV